ncbi:recombinase family protein [Streptomyces sp. NPDC093225]|uniref:recombinase family protein n=1 Tax=Streptomyces sp. NPDC093225 TaxID=3366034 RepID=UPI0037F5556D
MASLGLGVDELGAMGLSEPCLAGPDELVDVYLRRSNKGEDLATLRGHLREVVRWARAGGLQIRHVWFEQLSASKSHVRRRQFERAVQAVMDGKARTLAVWKADRFDRRGMGAVGRLLDEFDRRGSRLVSVSEGLDSANGGRLVFGILSERAREESLDIAKRVKMGHDSHKAEGRRGTGRPPFGLFSVPGSGKVEPHPAEYETARRLADLLLDGKTTKATAHQLNREGRWTRSGATWSPTAVSKLAQSPLFAAMVPVRRRRTDEHGALLDSWAGFGEPLRDAAGEIVMCGVGVVDPAEWFRIKAMIGARTDDRWSRGKPQTKHMGTGIYRCGRLRDKSGAGDLERCGAPMTYRGGRYRCSVRDTRGSAVCTGVVTLADRIDREVGLAWTSYVSRLAADDPEASRIVGWWLAAGDPEGQANGAAAQSALAAAQQRMGKLEEDFYVYGKMDEQRFEELHDGLRSVIESAETAVDAWSSTIARDSRAPIEMLRTAWEAANTLERRMLLKTALGAHGIVVVPAARRGDRSPILDRLVFDWLVGEAAEREE